MPSHKKHQTHRIHKLILLFPEQFHLNCSRTQTEEEIFQYLSEVSKTLILIPNRVSTKEENADQSSLHANIETNPK
jgi:hypothetical protein